jgi:site-specific recombinase XerD
MTNHLPVANTTVGVVNPAVPASHSLGHVVDDWHAIEVWLKAVASNSRNRSKATVNTYRYHLAKLRWFCERVIGRTPSAWSMQDVEAFREFLTDLPAFAISMGGAGSTDYTPFQVPPSPSSQSDILRFTRAMFGALHATGYIKINPMALTKAPASRELNVSRAINLDLYDTVLQVMDTQDRESLKERRGYLRDRFILVCLRESGLRASELVGAKMGAFKQFADPKARKTYWVLDVVADNAKGGKARTVPVTKVLMDALVMYRMGFGLPAYPAHGETAPLLLSPRTRKVELSAGSIRRTADKRLFGAWGSVGTRQGLHKIVTKRLEDAASYLDGHDEHEGASRLRDASSHWLRHTFATASLLKGQDIRSVAALLGHSSVNTTMAYTGQQTLDLVRALEMTNPDMLAVVSSAIQS